MGGVGSSLRQLKCYWYQRKKADAQLPCASRESCAAGRCGSLWRKPWDGRVATRLVGEGVITPSIQGAPPRRHGPMIRASVDVDPLRLPLTTIPSWLLEALVARPPCTQPVWAKSRSKAFCRTSASRVCLGAAIARRPLIAASRPLMQQPHLFAPSKTANTASRKSLASRASFKPAPVANFVDRQTVWGR